MGVGEKYHDCHNSTYPGALSTSTGLHKTCPDCCGPGVRTSFPAPFIPVSAGSMHRPSRLMELTDPHVSSPEPDDPHCTSPEFCVHMMTLSVEDNHYIQDSTEAQDINSKIPCRDDRQPVLKFPEHGEEQHLWEHHKNWLHLENDKAGYLSEDAAFNSCQIGDLNYNSRFWLPHCDNNFDIPCNIFDEKLDPCLPNEAVEVVLHPQKQDESHDQETEEIEKQGQACCQDLGILGIALRRPSESTVPSLTRKMTFTDGYFPNDEVPFDEEWKRSASTYERGKHWRRVGNDVLGHGAFGKCYVAVDMADTSPQYWMAVKELSKKCCDIQDIRNEVNILSKVQHPSILHYIRDTLEGDTFYIFTRLMRGGSLEGFLREYASHDIRLPETTVKWYTQQIGEGLDYLHSKSILHRDIKPANILLNGTYTQLVLADFGLSVCLEAGLSNMKTTALEGTPAYMAPESVVSYKHGKASDMWGVGCTLFEMATNQCLWDVVERMPLIYKIGSAVDPPGKLASADHLGLSSYLLDLVSWCLKVDPQDRPTTKQLLFSLCENDAEDMPEETWRVADDVVYTLEPSVRMSNVTEVQQHEDESIPKPSPRLQLAAIENLEDGYFDSVFE